MLTASIFQDSGGAAAAGGVRGGEILGRYFASCMDLGAIDKVGFAPLKKYLGLVDEAQNLFALTYVTGTLQRVGVHAFFGLEVDPLPADSRRSAVWVTQKGLGMPDRSYYLDQAKVKRYKKADEVVATASAALCDSATAAPKLANDFFS